jgi:cyclopropane-fatty-acyl-phospholipid synthase
MTTSTTAQARRPRPSPAPKVPGGREPERPAGAATMADVMQPLAEILLGDPIPIRLEFFDGSSLGPEGGPGTVHIRSGDALRRLVWAPGEIGLARAFVCGDVELEGDVFEVLRALQAGSQADLRFLGLNGFRAGLRAAHRLGALGRPLPPPPEEASPRGGRHSVRRDSASVRHHYDVGNDFYRLMLGPSLTYSCARFTDATNTLEDAQAAKFELICRKLGLHERPGARLLDVGCGWGSMLIHAARHHDAQGVGITVSPEQAELARRRVAEEGLGSRLEIRQQDYRDVGDERFDAISKPGSSKPGRRSFVYRYVFPDGELLDVGDTVLAMEEAGFEVRDVESLREHYVRTLHAWVANLEDHWDEAVALVGARRARVWRLYMAGCANRFQDAAMSVHQVLGVVTDGKGASHMPGTRRQWELPGRPSAVAAVP